MTDVGGRGWARRAGVAGAVLGLTAATVAAGVAVERLTVHRAVRRRARLALDATGPYGSLRGTPGRAVADDGTELYYETDEPEGGIPEGAPTVVFSHGYCLAQDVWHFQRAALRGTEPTAPPTPALRAVYWDQRGHGRSGRGRAGETVTIDRLGRDLKAVLDAAVPAGPVVLVGHSMGGMTMMALAHHHPGYVAERVAAVALLGTSAGNLTEVTYGLPAAGARALRRMAPGVLRTLAARADLVERGRRATADLFTGLVKRYSFGTRDVDPGVARFAERLIESVPVDVVADFYPAFAEHEKTAALAAFEEGRPALILTGDRDLLTPREHSEAMAGALPHADLVVVEGAGHLVMLEHPEAVNDRLAELLTRTIHTHGHTAPPGRGDRPRGRSGEPAEPPEPPGDPESPGDRRSPELRADREDPRRDP
ncbi:alpha/beta fold hydrolase [Streptomyces radiopugnans]|uniref:Pimeloyl-ACP methyl ester carboxylesterase n=1 Tax=Streptomyces radiopugnans TaxID=403935 RepID=A0A1H9GSD8_9ACTN|nr:alpha/beta hydrolase [Streptomyces radiopugnans]SEQ52975.1 Pimeloyl-ACP methyl ester carboxylesterase [Streptomyces radiopugnans]